ncbi:MAG: hypothetical protein NTW85_03425 [Methylococcales bacterium]|nr:hypothetical protein [Methylococcales bacterium]
MTGFDRLSANGFVIILLAVSSITCTGEATIERQTVVLPAGKPINLNSPQHFSLQHSKDGSVHIITTFIAN